MRFYNINIINNDMKLAKNKITFQRFDLDIERLCHCLAIGAALLAQSILEIMGRLPFLVLSTMQHIFSDTSDRLVLLSSGTCAIFRKRATKTYALSARKISVL